MMFRSVRLRLLLGSLAISMATLLVVGVVTLFLVDAYFSRQEQEYLRSQILSFAPTVARTLASDDIFELQREAAMISFAAQVRVRVLDADGQVVVDSGEHKGMALFNPITSDAPDVLIGVVVDDSGRVISLSPPVSRRTATPGGIALSFAQPSRLFDTTSSFIAISDERQHMSLTYADEAVGSLELSQGPAVGEAVIHNIRLALVIGSGVALLIATAVGLLSARQVTRPLLALGEAAKGMAADNLSARVPGSHLLEYDRLATQFNNMADRLEGTIGRLKKEREVLRRMITDASHELRTPLTALKTFNTLLRDEVPADSTATRFVNESEIQIRHLDSLTTSMLDLSRFEARLSGTDFVIADLRDTVNNAVLALRPLSEKKEHHLELNLPEEVVQCAHDPTAMGQAIGNVLHNAIKYTPAGGQIRLNLEESDVGFAIEVSDDGPGIPPQVQPHIFDRFYRVPEQPESGSGLGLAISREIAAIHGGSISLVSEPGRGSTFTIHLPKSAGVETRSPRSFDSLGTDVSSTDQG